MRNGSGVDGDSGRAFLVERASDGLDREEEGDGGFLLLGVVGLKESERREKGVEGEIGEVRKRTAGKKILNNVILEK